MLSRATFQKQKPRLILAVLILAVLSLCLHWSWKAAVGWSPVQSQSGAHGDSPRLIVSLSCGLWSLLLALPTLMLSPLRSHSWPSWTQCCAHLLLGLSSWQLWLYCKSPLCYWALFLCPEGLGPLILVPGKFNVLLTRLTSLTSSQDGSRLGSNRVLELREVFEAARPGRAPWWWGALLKVFFFC